MMAAQAAACAFCGHKIKTPYWARFCDAACALDFNTGETDRRPRIERETDLLEMQEAEHREAVARLVSR